MRTMRLILLMFAGFIMLVSCRDSLSIDVVEDAMQIQVYAFPSSNDTIEIEVSLCKPLNGRMPVFDIKDVICKTEGVHDRVEYIGCTEKSGIPVCRYIAVGEHSEGNEVSIDVIGRDGEIASARTVIPFNTSVSDARLDTIYYKGSPYSRLSLSFSRNEDKNVYYAVRVEGLIKRRESGESDLMEWQDLEISLEPMLNNNVYADLSVGGDDDYFNNLYLFDGANLMGNNVTLRLCMMQHSWINSYRAELFTLSKEFYFMLKSFNDIENNVFASHGLGFTYPSFSNVSGGIGCVAGFQVEHTEWLN